MSREVKLPGLRKLDFSSQFRSGCSGRLAVQRALSLWFCPARHCSWNSNCGNALVAALQSWRGDTALTLPLFWRRSSVSPGSFPQIGRYPTPGRAVHSLVLFLPVSPSRPKKQPPRLLSVSGRKARSSRCLVPTSEYVIRHQSPAVGLAEVAVLGSRGPWLSPRRVSVANKTDSTNPTAGARP